MGGNENGLAGNSGNWINSILHLAIDVYIYMNNEGVIQYVSPNVENILGFQAETLIGTRGLNFTKFADLPSQDYFYMETANGAGMNSSELRMMRADGSYLDVEVVQVNVASHSEAEGVVIAIRDITHKKTAENVIYHAAYHDYITDLPNRRLFQEELDQLTAMYALNMKKIAVLMFTFDQFKLVNDSLGLSSGDELLKQFVSKLKDVIVPGRKAYRIGNDDFCIVFSDVHNEKEVLDFAELFVHAVREEQFIVNNYELRITISAGIAILPSDGENSESLLRNAIAALNYAKQQGGDQVRSYSTSLNVHAFKRFTLYNDLNKAIENNELFLEYMPIADSQNLEITGVEALIRWQHPDWGVVMPEEFIPIAEETGLIDTIGEWVIIEATRMNQSWINSGLSPIVVAVNVSSRQLLNRSFVDIIDRCLEQTQMSPEYLEIEITESVAINDLRDVRSILLDLKKRRVMISLDDFGAGFSSLHQLANLPINKLKIDRSFIKDNLFTNENKNVVEHIIGLAKSLKVGIVAEGVESAEQYEFLKKLGCNEIQGYYLSPPLSPEEFEKSLKHHAFKSRQQEIARDPFSNRRKYFRLELSNPLIADLTISMFKGKKVNLGSTQAYISNIGPSGLKFIMNIKFPINDDILLVFKVLILNNNYILTGKVAWLREVDSKGIYEYGVHFVIEPKEQDELIQTLNRLAIYMRDGLPPHTTYYLGDPITLLKESRK